MAETLARSTSGRREIARAAALGGMWLAMRPRLSAAEVVANTVLNVREFGAKGDGKTDDTKSIQSAIDAAAARGCSVYVPPGVYRSAELQMRPHVSVTGIPAWDYEHAFGSVIRLAHEHARCLLNATGAFGMTVDGLSLDGGKLGAGVHGVWLNKPDYGNQEDTFPYRTVPDREFYW
ncbi:MAG: glycosyl hydrolase family 28-related protein [Bryobacteraceae bacterium]